MPSPEVPVPQDSVNQAGSIKNGFQNIEAESVSKKLDAVSASIRRNTLQPRAVQVHSFAPFPAHTIEEVIDGNIVTTSQPLLPIDVSRNAGYYLTLKGTIKYYPRKHRKSGSSLAVNGSRDTTPLEYLNLVDPAIEAMEKAVDDKVKDDTERVWKQDVQKQADEGYFTAQVEKLRDSGNPLIRRAMDLVDAAGEADNLALEMQRMEEIHPDLIESSNALTYQISQRNFRFSLQSPGRGFNIGITRVHKPLLDELYHVEISTEGKNMYEDLHGVLFTDDGQIIDALDSDDNILAEVLYNTAGKTPEDIEESKRKAQVIVGEIESVLSSPDWDTAARDFSSKKEES